MNKITRLSVAILILLASFACKRDQDPIGGVETAPAGSPEYKTAQLDVAAHSGLAVVSDIAPSQGEQEALSPEALYVKVCAACHQATGKGIPGAFPPLDASPYVVSDNTERLAAIMLYGLVGPIKVNGVEYNSAMAALGGTNSDEDLAAIATYIRSAWSNKAAEVDASVFAAAREKWGSRGPFNITELGEESE